MLVTIQKVEQDFTRNGDEYYKVTGVTGDGKQTTKSVFNNLSDKWPLLKEGVTLDFKMVKKGQFWNVSDILPVELPEPQEPINPPPQIDEPKVLPTGETPPKSDKVRISKEVYFKDIISMQTMCLSYAKDQVIKLVEMKAIPYEDISGATQALADGYLDWLNKKLSKWL